MPVLWVVISLPVEVWKVEHNGRTEVLLGLVLGHPAGGLNTGQSERRCEVRYNLTLALCYPLKYRPVHSAARQLIFIPQKYQRRLP